MREKSETHLLFLFLEKISTQKMRKFGLLKMDIILERNLFEEKELRLDLLLLSSYCDGIYKNAFDYDKCEKLVNIDNIDLTLDTTYIIEYRVDKNNFFIELYKNYLMMSFSKYSDIALSTLLIPILQKYVLRSCFTLAGFETTLFLDEYPSCIDSILDDKSLYPLYVNETQEYLSFKRYAGYKPMEDYIEIFLHDIFGVQIEIKEVS